MEPQAHECCLCRKPTAWSLEVSDAGEESAEAILVRVSTAVKSPIVLLACGQALCANCYSHRALARIGRQKCPTCFDPIPAGEFEVIEHDWASLFEGSGGRAIVACFVATGLGLFGKLPLGPVVGALATERFLELANGDTELDGRWWRRGFMTGAAGGWAALTVYSAIAVPRQWLSITGMIQVADIPMWKKVLRVPAAGILGLATFGGLARVGSFARDSMSGEMNGGRPPIRVDLAKFLGIFWVTTLVAVPTHRFLQTRYDLKWWMNPGLLVGPIAGAYMVDRLAT